MAETEHKPYKYFLKTDSPYLGEWDLPLGNDIVLTIKSVKEGDVTGEKGRVDHGMVIYFEEPNVKPLFCNITNAKIIEHIYKTRFVDEWCGKKIQLYVDDNITFGHQHNIRGIRVRSFEPKTNKVEYHCCKCNKVITKEIYDGSMAKYHKAYCSKECLDKDTKGEDLL